MLTSEVNRIIIEKLIDEHVKNSSGNNYILIDGDKTLAPVDSTVFFFESIGFNFLDIKSIFQEFGYSFEGFLKVAKYYSRVPIDEYNSHCKTASEKVEIYPEFLKFIKRCLPISNVIIITSGLRRIWEYVIAKNDLSNHVSLIGGNHLELDSYIVDKATKGFIIDRLHLNDKKTWAFGESLVDFDMLVKAHKGYLVVNNKKNKDVYPLLKSLDHISQVSLIDFFHPALEKKMLEDVFSEICSTPTK